VDHDEGEDEDGEAVHEETWGQGWCNQFTVFEKAVGDAPGWRA
jgi:hypothetical protein